MSFVIFMSRCSDDEVIIMKLILSRLKQVSINIGSVCSWFWCGLVVGFNMTVIPLLFQ